MRCAAWPTLVEAGATVVGRRPAGSPSLADDDARARARSATGCGASRPGADADLAARCGLGASRLTVEGAELLRIGRRTAAGEVVFLANPAPEPVTVTVATAGGRPLVAWDPVTLRREALPDGRRLDSARRSVGVPRARRRRSTPPWADPAAEIALDGAVAAHPARRAGPVLPDGPRPWTELGPAAAGFAGIGTYTTEVDMDGEPLGGATAVLDARATSATSPGCGSTASTAGVVWTAPWRVDVTGRAASRPQHDRGRRRRTPG